MKTVKNTLIVLATLAVVGLFVRIGYIAIQKKNEQIRLQGLLDSEDFRYKYLLSDAEDCKCFPENELKEWKAKLKKLHTPESVYYFKTNLDMLQSKTIEYKYSRMDN